MKLGDLGTFEGSPVTTAKVKVTHAGDGLSKAMNVEPVAYAKGDRVVIVLDCVVDRIEFVSGEVGADLCRVHVFKAGQAIVVERTLVAEMMAEQAERIRQAEDALKGIQSLEGTVPDLPEEPTPIRGRRPRRTAPTEGEDVDGADG